VTPVARYPGVTVAVGGDVRKNRGMAEHGGGKRKEVETFSVNVACEGGVRLMACGKRTSNMAAVCYADNCCCRIL